MPNFFVGEGLICPQGIQSVLSNPLQFQFVQFSKETVPIKEFSFVLLTYKHR